MARPLLGAASVPVAVVFGDTGSAGTAGANAALADHRHAHVDVHGIGPIIRARTTDASYQSIEGGSGAGYLSILAGTTHVGLWESG